MPKVNKTDQLRVRLTPEEKRALENLIVQRGKNETISDLIREALSWCLTPGNYHEPLRLAPDLRAKISAIARDLNRSEDQIIGDCIQGIMDLIEKPERQLPLIVLEIQLRRQYEQHKEKSSAPTAKKMRAKASA
jgi:Arc/MetJ-type ribon-helix-helix transcriptional regulator